MTSLSWVFLGCLFVGLRAVSVQHPHKKAPNPPFVPAPVSVRQIPSTSSVITSPPDNRPPTEMNSRRSLYHHATRSYGNSDPGNNNNKNDMSSTNRKKKNGSGNNQEKSSINTAGNENNGNNQEKSSINTAGNENNGNNQEKSSINTAGNENNGNNQEKSSINTAGNENNGNNQEKSSINTAGNENNGKSNEKSEKSQETETKEVDKGTSEFTFSGQSDSNDKPPYCECTQVSGPSSLCYSLEDTETMACRPRFCDSKYECTTSQTDVETATPEPTEDTANNGGTVMCILKQSTTKVMPDKVHTGYCYEDYQESWFYVPYDGKIAA